MKRIRHIPDPYAVTSRTRLLVLWTVFGAEAFAIAIWASWDSPIMGEAVVVAFILGMPLSLIMAAAARRKPLMRSIVLGTLLVGCATAVAGIAFTGNPIALGGLVLLSAGALWICVPDVPQDHGHAACPHCGYSLEGLTPGSKCPERPEGPAVHSRGQVRPRRTPPPGTIPHEPMDPGRVPVASRPTSTRTQRRHVQGAHQPVLPHKHRAHLPRMRATLRPYPHFPLHASGPRITILPCTQPSTVTRTPTCH